jgi:signal transduction histidine kinase/DNA-binding NarL/FixJ family response regulator/HPt (histidine-containing phosphotransfer) domain-containing protein
MTKARVDTPRDDEAASRGNLVSDESGGGKAEAEIAALKRRLAELETELRDELAKKKAELEAARAVAELANRAKTAFLANMSHEIRTPLSAVMGYANLIAATEQAADETREWSKRLQRSAEHLLALLDDVLDLAKIEAGKLDLHFVSCDPTTVLEEVGVLMEPRAQDKGLVLTVAADTELPARFRTDPLRLRQILINLVGNAVKYTPRGEVSVHARLRMSPVGRSFERRLEIEVGDTGVGIPGHELKRLFLPFEQGQGRPNAGGVGLGLDISRRLARLLGGDIDVRSEVGVGSVFTLTLPVDGGADRGTTPARLVTRSGVLKPSEPVVPRLDKRVVLVVDDAEDNRRIVTYFLKQAGAEVVEAATLRAAEQIMAEPTSGVELVVTDLQLTDGNGLSLIASMAARGDSRPVVALTADAMLETRELAMAAGVADFMVKPVVAWRLVSRVGALLQEGARVGSRVEPASVTPTGPMNVGRPTRTPLPEASKLLRNPTPTPADAVERASRPALKRFPTAPQGVVVSQIDGVEARVGRDPQRVPTAPSHRPTIEPDTARNRRPEGVGEGTGVGELAGGAVRPDVPVDLLTRYYGMLSERVMGLEEGLAACDAARLRDLAHRIAGSGATMGHPELTELGRLVERAVIDDAGWEAIGALGARLLAATGLAARTRPWLA